MGTVSEAANDKTATKPTNAELRHPPLYTTETARLSQSLPVSSRKLFPPHFAVSANFAKLHAQQ